MWEELTEMSDVSREDLRGLLKRPLGCCGYVLIDEQADHQREELREMRHDREGFEACPTPPGTKLKPLDQGAESVVTQWRRYSWGGWWRYIGTKAVSCTLSAYQPYGTWWCWKVTVPPEQDYAVGGNASTAGEAKQAATEAGYALLKRLEEGSA